MWEGREESEAAFTSPPSFSSLRRGLCPISGQPPERRQRERGEARKGTTRKLAASLIRRPFICC